MKNIKTLEKYPNLKEEIKKILTGTTHEITGGSVYLNNDERILCIGIAGRDRRERLPKSKIFLIKQIMHKYGLKQLVINGVNN